MPIPLIGAAITGVSSLAGGLLNRPKTTTSTPTYTPQQTALQAQVGDTLTDRLSNPANLTPQKTAAFGDVNKTYAGLEDRLTQRLAGNGYGTSGKLGTNLQQLEIARAGDIGATNDRFAKMQLDQNNLSLEQALGFAFNRPGTTTTGSGNVLGGAIGSGAETATLLYALSHFLGGGSAPGGGINPGYANNPLGGGNYGAGPGLPPGGFNPGGFGDSGYGADAGDYE